MIGRVWAALVAAACAWIGLGGVAGPLLGQERSLATAPYGATAQERLLMEQIEQLARAGQLAEANTNLRRLVDNCQGRVVEAGAAQQAATLTTQLHLPITRWANRSLIQWAQQNRAAIDRILAGEEELAQRALSEAGLDARNINQVVERYPLAPAVIPAHLVLCDLYLDRGWTTAARQAIDVPGLAWRAGSADSFSGQGVPWPAAWPHLKQQADLPALLDQSWPSITTQLAGSSERLKLELLSRSAHISALDSTQAEFQSTTQWIEQMSQRLPSEMREQLQGVLERAREQHTTGQRWLREQSFAAWTFAGNAQRNNVQLASSQFELKSWPSWSRQVERITGAADRNPASQPPVAESPMGLLPYHPVVFDGKLFVHELTRVMAYDLASGDSWPKTRPALPLFDSGLTAASLLPLGYQFMGAPRGTLTIDQQVLYARMGTPITAWHGKIPNQDARSLSFLIALDLARQGSMRPGFPVHLPADAFPSTEFEGPPIISGHQAIACISTRDNVNLRRSLVSIDTRSGQVQWRSPVLGAGMVSGSEQLSLIAHQLPTAAGGRVFVNTNLGSIACVDQSDGHIVWLVRYKRSPPTAEEPYPKPDRYRYRDLTPCMIVGTQVICAPQDCPEIFALDITSGDLLWSTDGEQVDDATQLLGICDDNLLISGDRLYWLDSRSGQVLAAFPGGNIGEVANALPTPRGYGRGVVAQARVYWPTANEIFVFEANQTAESLIKAGPRLRERIRLDTRGAEGGNLALFKDGLVIASASRIFVYR